LCSALDLELILNLVIRESYEEDIGEFDSEYSSESEEGSNLSDFIDDDDVEPFYSMDDGDAFFSHDHHRPGT